MVECPLLNPAAIPHHHLPTLLRLLPQPNCLGPQKVWSERRGKDDLVVWSVGRSVAFRSNFLNTEVKRSAVAALAAPDRDRHVCPRADPTFLHAC